MATQAHLYDASGSPAVLLASISAANLDASSYYQPQVYGGQPTAFVNRSVALELSLEISIEGRAEDDATLDLLRADFALPTSRAYELVYTSGAKWSGNFVLTALQESAPEADERMFFARLANDGVPTYTAAP